MTAGAGILPMCADCTFWRAFTKRETSSYGRCAITHERAGDSAVTSAVDRCEGFIAFVQLTHRAPAPPPPPDEQLALI